MQQFSIAPGDSGQRFDKYIHKLLPEAPMSLLYKMLRKKNITLNKKKADGREMLKAGDQIEMFFSEETFLKFTYSEEQLQKDVLFYEKAFKHFSDIPVVYEDDDLIFLNKPAGILSQKGTPTDISINEWMIGYLLHKKHITRESLKQFHPSVCNRLDRNTSGLILCGKTLRGTQFLSTLLKDRSLHKYYRTYVSGHLSESRHLTGYLLKDERTNKVTIKQELNSPDDRYDFIETAYTPVGYAKTENVTALEVLLITGKSHQIRAHLAGIGYPLIGDHKYGKNYMGYSHQMLHAYRIAFPTLEGDFTYLSNREWIAALPKDFQRLEELTCQHGTPEV